MFSVFVFERFGIGQDRNFHMERGQLARGQRFETVIVEGGVESVAFDTVDDTLHGGKTADAAPQVALFMQGNENTLPLVKYRRFQFLSRDRPIRVDP